MNSGSQWEANGSGPIGAHIREFVTHPGWRDLTAATGAIVLAVTIGQLWQVGYLLGGIGPAADSCYEGYCFGPMILGICAASILLVTLLWVWGRRRPLVVADALILIATLGQAGTLGWNGQLWVATALVGLAGAAFLQVTARQRGSRAASG